MSDLLQAVLQPTAMADLHRDLQASQQIVYNQVPLWERFEQYSPGDLVYALQSDKAKRRVSRCKQEPFGDFCTEYGPRDNVAGAWELITSTDQYEELLPPSSNQIECQLYKSDGNYKRGDLVCIEGQDYVWECK